MERVVRYTLGLFIWVALPNQLVQAQALTGTWIAHTTARAITDASVSSSVVWAASRGGVFSYDRVTGEITSYTAAEGLYTVEAQAIAHDPSQNVVWVGYNDGVIDRLDVATGHVRTFFDIQRSERFPDKNINRMRLQGDSLLVATAFGLVVFDTRRDEVRDTYSRLGLLPAATAVHDLVVAPLPNRQTGLILGTEAGVVWAPLSASNLQDPESWTVEVIESLTPEVRAIHAQDGSVLVGTDSGIHRRQAGGRFNLVTATPEPIYSFTAVGDRVLATARFRVYEISATGASQLLGGYQDLQRVVSISEDEFWLADRELGLSHFQWSLGATEPNLLTASIFPDGPFDSPFGDLQTDVDGNLWAAAVTGLPMSGFYRMRPSGEWTNFTTRFVSELYRLGDFWVVHAANNGAWAGSRGGGLAHIDAADQVTIYNSDNSTLLPAVGTSNYIIVHGIASESDGTLWMTNTIAPNPLHVRSPDGQWTGLPPPICENSAPPTALGPMMIDSNGNKWIILQNPGNLNFTSGLIILDTKETPSDSSDDDCQFYNESALNGTGLPGSQITSITEDLTGRIWISTDGGIAYFRTSSVAASDPSVRATWPVWGDPSLGSYALRGLQVNDIAVDPSNRLWVATDDGVYLIQEGDGFELVHQFGVDNSPLFSNVIQTIAVDARTGRVFMGTDKGLISYQSDAIQPAEAAQDLFIYPNPVRIETGAEPEIYIEGLVAETELSILTVDGTLIDRFDTRGGRVRWDARDQRGSQVPSGMYLVVASGKNGEGVAYGKIAVIR